jgi:hypothetical protein
MIRGLVYSPKSDEETELWFKAKMTERQFQAISLKFSKLDFVKEIKSNSYFQKKLKVSSICKMEDVKKYLKNSLNTENVLISNELILQSSNNSFVMQWAFPQAYYSVFTSIVAFSKLIGITNDSHRHIINNYGKQYFFKHFPESIAYYVDGVKSDIKYFNISKPAGLDSMDFNEDDILTIDNQICQALKSTREMKFDEQVYFKKYKNPKGELYKSIPRKIRIEVSNDIGFTTVLDFLYRKRIKANYRNIDTFSSDYFDGLLVLRHLCYIVDRLNFMSEMYIANCLGKKKYSELIKNLQISLTKNQQNRFEDILKNI